MGFLTQTLHCTRRETNLYLRVCLLMKQQNVITDAADLYLRRSAFQSQPNLHLYDYSIFFHFRSMLEEYIETSQLSPRPFLFTIYCYSTILHKITHSSGNLLYIFDVHVTVHRDKFLIRKPTRCTNFSNFFLE